MTRSIESAIPAQDEIGYWGPSDVLALAYRLWQTRGCPIGSSEEGWFRPEKKAIAPQEAGAGGVHRVAKSRGCAEKGPSISRIR